MRRIYIFSLLGIVAVLISVVFKDAYIREAVSETTSSDTQTSAQKTGSISGRVIYQGEPPSPQKLMVVKDVAICGKVNHYDERLVIGVDKGIKNTVISLVNVTGGKTLQAMGTKFVLNQKSCTYQPHVLVVPVNTPIQVVNPDKILHNIHTYSMKNPPMNLAQPGTKKKMNVVFKTPERISVRCDIHGWMSGWVVVVDHPYYVVTDATGKFTLDGIPPGTYTVNCWQELLGEQTTEVVVTAGAPVKLDFKY